MLNKIYLYSKKLHRWLVVFVVLLGLIMMGTGIMMKYPAIADLVRADIFAVRQIHNLTSTYFVGVLLLMMTTGLFMFLFPYLKRSSQQIKG